MIGIILYERCFVPIAKRFTGKHSGLTCLQRMGVGFVINIIATTVSALVEMKRKNVAAKYNLLDDPKAIIPISVFWLVPQYCLHGVAEVFMSVGHLEFLYDQSPESMRSSATALYCIATAIGSFIGTLLVTLVHDYTGKERNWLPDRNLNRGRLECYYFLVSGIQVVNFVYYVICAGFYSYKPLEEISEVNKEEDLEQVNGKVTFVSLKDEWIYVLWWMYKFSSNCFCFYCDVKSEMLNNTHLIQNELIKITRGAMFMYNWDARYMERLITSEFQPNNCGRWSRLSVAVAC